MQQKILAAALRLLARRNHSAAELQKKLQRKFPQEEESIENCLEMCREKNWINDENYAAEFIRYRQQTAPRGKHKLRQELLQKGISSEIISVTLEKISSSLEHQHATQLAQKKSASFSRDLPIQKQKERLFRFLKNKGFATPVIWDVLREILDAEPENT